MTFHQTQDGVLQYAQEILQNGLPPGVLMIDDGWSDCYGRWQFSREKFRDPASMLTQLHRLGFPVMLWICPFVTPDTPEYRELERRGLLVASENGLPHIAHWWNGWSAVLDMTKPAARRWLKQQLDELQALGVDGFKFDAGDSVYYPSDGINTGDEHCRAWAAFGEQYSFNEFRVTSGAGGWSLTQRLCDKDHSWGNTGLAALIPDAIVQSLTDIRFVSGHARRWRISEFLQSGTGGSGIGGAMGAGRLPDAGDAIFSRSMADLIFRKLCRSTAGSSAAQALSAGT